MEKLLNYKEENMEKCKLVIFSDIHYAPERPVNNGSIIDRKLTECAIPVLEKLIDEINNKIKPNVAINLGDLIEDFNDHDKDIINLNFIWNLLKRIEAPFYSIIGNHDLRSMSSRTEVEQIMGYEHSTFSVDVLGYHFVFLGLNVNNTSNVESGGILKTRCISKEDLKWLKEDLENTNLPTIVFSHYGIAEDDMKGNWWFEKHPDHAVLGNREEVKEIFKKDKNLLAVFSGHQHWTKKTIEDGINYYVVGSLTENINDDGVPDGVYFEVTLEGNKIEVEEKHIRLNE